MRFPSVALLLLAGCASHPALRLLDRPADYAQLGMTPAVAAREDGRRTRPGSDDFEWWYLDGVAADGTVVVVWFGDNWLVGTHLRAVSIEITPPGQPTQRAAYTTTEPGEFARETADVRIGPHRFAGDLRSYRVQVVAREASGLGCDLTLESHVAPFRPGTGVLASGGQYFAWLAAVPEGALSGTLELQGRTVRFAGSGYHDHNWGNAPPWDLLRGWWWGRGELGGKVVIAIQLRPARGRGEFPVPLLYVAGPDGLVTGGNGEPATLAEAPLAPHGDERHDAWRPAGVSLRSATAAGVPVSADFKRVGMPLTSANLLGGQRPVLRWLAGLLGRRPWYTRWRSAIRLEVDGATASGKGTLEEMDFE